MARDNGSNFAIGGFNMAQAMANQQGGHLAGMANQAMGAIQSENEKRAAIAREMRRMEYERDLRERQMEHERQMKQMELDALINRLGNTGPKMSGPDTGMHFMHSPDRGWQMM